jgi:signal transduction histidine kinase
MTVTDKTNILVVDDLPEKLLVYGTILEELGQNVVTAYSGADALKKILQYDFAVIVLDVNMPDMDGFETASLIRNRKRSAHTPIIFVTAFLDELRAVQGYAHGAVDYILAPVVPEVLRAKIKVFVELFQMHQQVKKQAEERVVLAEERVKRAAAEEANRCKDEFLAMLAHELRNPLAPICNSVQLMRLMTSNQPDLKKVQDVIDRQLGNLTRLVDDLLDVSRITSGKVRLKLESLDVAIAVAAAVETSRPLIEARQQELNLTLPPTSVRVKADQTRLAQVLSNLLNNSAKYTQPGGRIWLNVTTEGSDVVFRVRDNGTGIQSDILPRVFDLFTQADQSLDRAQGGLGIGLTLVRRLVEMHHGTVHAYSKGPGDGSEFVVRLPVLIVEPTLEPTSTGPSPTNSLCSKRRVLVVDDNLDTAESLAMLIQVDGHIVRTANDGLAALKAFAEFRPDVVILDIGLPNMNGYEVARRLRDQHQENEFLMAALTGYGAPEDRNRSEKAGFDNHLVKPVGLDDLRRLLS